MPCVWVDRHETASEALRLRVLAEAMEGEETANSPDAMKATAKVTIKSDLFRAQLGVLPGGMAGGGGGDVGCRRWRGRGIGSAWRGVGEGDRVVVHFGGQVEKLVERGVPRGQIEVRPLRRGGIALLSHASGHRDCGQKHGTRERVALIGDLAPTNAATLKVELPTHLAVFAAASELVREEYLTIHPGMAADVLRRALGRAGVHAKTEDTALQAPMLRMIREVLIPSVPPLVLAGELAAQGVAVTLIGDWPGADSIVGGGDVRQVAFEAYEPAVWGDVALLVHHSPEGTFSPLVWEAMAAGVALVISAHAGEKTEGSLGGMLEADKHYARAGAGNWLRVVKGLLRDADRRERLVDGARMALRPE